jgi:hypothetical protein
MGNLPGFRAVGSGYDVGLGSSGSGVFTGVTDLPRGVGDRSGCAWRFGGVAGAEGIPFRGFSGGGTPFGGLGCGTGRYGAKGGARGSTLLGVIAVVRLGRTRGLAVHFEVCEWCTLDLTSVLALRA